MVPAVPLSPFGSFLSFALILIVFIYLAVSIYRYIMAPKPNWRGLMKIIMLFVAIEIYFAARKFSHSQTTASLPWYLLSTIWPINYLTGSKV